MHSMAENGGNGRGAGANRGATRASARREREREIVDATRALFDERGVQNAPMEEIARAVGINKALIYRHFGSQEELFVHTVSRYLADLDERFSEVDESLDPITQLSQVSDRYVRFCLEYPAFLDCALSLMRRPFAELGESVSPGVLFQLGQAMSACISRLSRILAAGSEQGLFEVDDPDFVANLLYSQGLGAMHLGRVGVGVREIATGVPQVFPVDPERVASTALEVVMGYVLTPNGNGQGGAHGEGAGGTPE